jgi:putative restriction endonuclease
MFSKCIEIKWIASTEYIPFDSDQLPSGEFIGNTIEHWPEENEWIKYSPRVIEFRQEGRKIFINLDYIKPDHPDAKEDYLDWGESEIHFDLDTKEGAAFWKSSVSNEYTGKKPVKFIDESLQKPKTKVTRSVSTRNQSPFRKALLAADKRCAVTGEVDLEVLEAAHIIPSMNDGGEFLDNGILLRADIHRLFDSKKITIADNGKIEIRAILSDSYKSLLADKVIPESVIKRIRKALILSNEIP